MYIGLHVHCIHASYIHVGLHTCMQNDEGDEKQWPDKDVDRRGAVGEGDCVEGRILGQVSVTHCLRSEESEESLHCRGRIDSSQSHPVKSISQTITLSHSYPSIERYMD